MKRFIIIIMAVAICTAVKAADLGYLVLRQTDGTLTSLAAKGLKLVFSNGSAVATAADGTVTTLPLSGLSAMYLSQDGTTGISEAVATQTDTAFSVYSLTGVRVARGGSLTDVKAGLQPGVYIVKTNSRTFKIEVR